MDHLFKIEYEHMKYFEEYIRKFFYLYRNLYNQILTYDEST